MVKKDQAVANMAGGCQDMMPGDEEEVDDVDEDCDIIEEEDGSIKTKNVLEAAVKSESGSSSNWKGKGAGANCFIWDTFIVNVQNSAFLFL